MDLIIHKNKNKCQLGTFFYGCLRTKYLMRMSYFSPRLTLGCLNVLTFSRAAFQENPATSQTV